MKFALIQSGVVHSEATEADAGLIGPDNKPLFDIRDVSEVDGIEPGWLAMPDGSFRPPPAASPAVIIVYRSDLYRRCTEDEAEKIDAALAQQPIRLRQIFGSVVTFRSDDELWPTLQTAAEGLFGKERAAELLAGSL